ncbi:leucine-rich repeat-containing protein 70-like [Anthonomus grandis grandis]|uniref:leucine-rich repeat-containing protein 70-like n=1 Tax=Anthonomus grandis grandis TaxID=2921223 RepID=UPI00216548B7|nr:leucine-rich repeat-containing protein 70-like [Anthonomus grandis grandis]
MKSQVLQILIQFCMMAIAKKCISSEKPHYRIYKTLEDFRKNNDTFASENNTILENGIMFDFPQLKVVPANGFVTYDADSITYLNLSGKSINVLEIHAFSNLSCLQVLDLSNNDLWNLNRDMFSDLANLKYLDLKMNNLSVLGSETFGNLLNLKVLDLSHNNISNISNNAFNAGSKLDTLILSFNILRQIPQGIGNLKQLKKLYLDHNYLAIVKTTSLKPCRKLKILDLTENQAVILRLGNDTLNPRYLQVLNLSSNYLLYFNISEVVGMFANSSTAIDLNENQFSCNIWKSYLQEFKKFNVTISPGRNFSAFRQINGIACDNLNITEIKDPNFIDFLNSKQKSKAVKRDESSNSQANSSNICVIVIFSIMASVVCTSLIAYFILKRKTRFYFTNIASDSIHITRSEF